MVTRQGWQVEQKTNAHLRCHNHHTCEFNLKLLQSHFKYIVLYFCPAALAGRERFIIIIYIYTYTYFPFLFLSYRWKAEFNLKLLQSHFKFLFLYPLYPFHPYSFRTGWSRTVWGGFHLLQRHRRLHNHLFIHNTHGSGQPAQHTVHHVR